MKRFIALVAAAIAILAIAAAPALAEGYNDPGQYTRAGGYFSGPHGGYTTTTNKCADCHSTHYATGSYMLLRADSREAACDYCHGGGGGSTINIMMDNDYKTVGSDMSTGVAQATDSMGKGTGHTLGYKGEAPGDIQPAYSDTQGLACFDCHSPHGNSKRILTTFSNPGRAIGKDNLVVAPGAPNFVGNGDGTLNTNGEWGIDPQFGNLKWWTSGKLVYRPIWPNGRFLLIKDPDAETSADTIVAAVGTTATAGVNKYKIDWNEPLGPADGSYGGGQNNDNDNAFPFAPKQTVDTDGNGQLDAGFLAESEFCTDCHDGMAGASTQKAEVYKPGEGYVVAASHDAQPRH
jgi:hypothetical protein